MRWKTFGCRWMYCGLDSEYYESIILALVNQRDRSVVLPSSQLSDLFLASLLVHLTKNSSWLLIPSILRNFPADGMDKLLEILKPLAEHNQLQSLSLLQLIEFLTRVSLLKRSILLAKRSAEPTDQPPDVLPRLIQRFLSESTGVDMRAIPDAWSILKDYAWAMPTVSSLAEKEKADFRAHGWSKGLSELVQTGSASGASLLTKACPAGITLFPPGDCCLNDACKGRNKELKTMESRKVVIYTADGAYPGHSIHLICMRECTFLWQEVKRLTVC